MGKVIAQRMTAQVEGECVVFLIGMRINRFWKIHKWLPVEETHRRLDGYHNAASVMTTLDFAEVERSQHLGDWSRLGTLLAGGARQLERGGADFLPLCTNTMHKEAEAIERAVRIPFFAHRGCHCCCDQKRWTEASWSARDEVHG
jgi:hypothetical protein